MSTDLLGKEKKSRKLLPEMKLENTESSRNKKRELERKLRFMILWLQKSQETVYIKDDLDFEISAMQVNNK